MIVYVQEKGAVVQKRAEGIEVRKQGALLYRIPLIGLERLVVIGMVQVTTQALYILSAQGIDVVYLNANGRIKCTIASTKSDNVFLRLAQYQRATDAAYRLQFAKGIVYAKISSQLRMIRSQKWQESFDWQSVCSELETLRASVEERDTLDALRGVEGIASRMYFNCFAQRMTKLPFGGRSRRPAKDEANALLNLGYTLLTNECVSLLDACGFDCGLGFIHGVVYGRQSLALDIIEPFRADVVDRLTLRLCNLGMLTAQSFTADPVTGYRLTPEGFRLFLEQYEKHMTEKDMPLRSALHAEMSKLRHALMEGITYRAWEGAS